MAEAFDSLELVAAPAAGDDGAEFTTTTTTTTTTRRARTTTTTHTITKTYTRLNTTTINDLPKELLVSVFEAVGDQTWVRHHVPLVCRAWAELYRSQDASPLHETLEVNFRKEFESAAAREWGEVDDEEEEWACDHPFHRSRVSWAADYPVHASRVISWVERRAGSVRKLRVMGGFRGAFADFSSWDLGRLVAAAGSSLTELRIGSGLEELRKKRFWESLRDSVAPAGQLRSLVVWDSGVRESDVEPLGQLAGSLEELELETAHFFEDPECSVGIGLPRFLESLCALKELRRLVLIGHRAITAIPARISSLKKLEELGLDSNLSSMPKELGELSGLTKLDLTGNINLGNAPQDEAFPAELGKMKSLRELVLYYCGLSTVPAFVGELESLEELDLSRNDGQIFATLDVLIEGCPRLHQVWLEGMRISPESLAHLEAFEAELLAKNPNAVVIFDESDVEGDTESE